MYSNILESKLEIAVFRGDIGEIHLAWNTVKGNDLRFSHYLMIEIAVEWVDLISSSMVQRILNCIQRSYLGAFESCRNCTENVVINNFCFFIFSIHGDES